jgi:hypothetical protein
LARSKLFLLLGGVAILPIALWRIQAAAAGFGSDLWLVQEQGLATWLGSVSARAAEILRFLGQLIGQRQDYGWLLGCVGLGLMFLFLRRARAHWRIHVVVVAQLLVAFGAFLVTPHDLAWHLPTALHRLLLQTFPCAVLVLLTGMSVVFWPAVHGERIVDATPDPQAEPTAFEV